MEVYVPLREKNRNTRGTITALAVWSSPKTVIMVAAHMHEPTSLICSLRQVGLATVIRPLVLVSVVSNIGEMHVLKF